MKPQATIEDIEFAPERTLSLETGRIAKQANGSAVVRLGDTMVLSTATISDSVKNSDFFPLTSITGRSLLPGARSRVDSLSGGSPDGQGDLDRPSH